MHEKDLAGGTSVTTRFLLHEIWVEIPAMFEHQGIAMETF